MIARSRPPTIRPASFPLVFTPEIVAHEEPAAQNEVAQLGGLRVGEVPLAYLDGVKEGKVVDVIVVVEIHRLLDGARVDAG